MAISFLKNLNTLKKPASRKPGSGEAKTSPLKIAKKVEKSMNTSRINISPSERVNFPNLTKTMGETRVVRFDINLRNKIKNKDPNEKGDPEILFQTPRIPKQQVAFMMSPDLRKDRLLDQKKYPKKQHFVNKMPMLVSKEDLDTLKSCKGLLKHLKSDQPLSNLEQHKLQKPSSLNSSSSNGFRHKQSSINYPKASLLPDSKTSKNREANVDIKIKPPGFLAISKVSTSDDIISLESFRLDSDNSAKLKPKVNHPEVQKRGSQLLKDQEKFEVNEDEESFLSRVSFDVEGLEKFDSERSNKEARMNNFVRRSSLNYATGDHLLSKNIDFSEVRKRLISLSKNLL